MNLRNLVLIPLLILGVLGIGVVAGVAWTKRQHLNEESMKIFAYHALASEKLEEGELDEAALAAMGTIILEPAAYFGYVLLGDAYAKQGRTNSAQWAYQQALRKLDAGGSSRFFNPSDKEKIMEKCIIKTKAKNPQPDNFAAARYCASTLKGTEKAGKEQQGRPEWR